LIWRIALTKQVADRVSQVALRRSRAVVTCERDLEQPRANRTVRTNLQNFDFSSSGLSFISQPHQRSGSGLGIASASFAYCLSTHTSCKRQATISQVSLCAIPQPPPTIPLSNLMNECFTISLTECIHVDKHILPFCSLILYGKHISYTSRHSMFGIIC
jgi:hypothetical protein